MHRNKTLNIVLATIVSATAINSVCAHEMWIDPTDYQLSSGNKIVANMKVGQNFSGFAQRYNPNEVVTLTKHVGTLSANIEGRLGNSPAIDTEPLADGLTVLGFHSTVLTTSYETLEKFQAFVDHKDFKGAMEQHAARGLPTEKFTESYIRFAKSLVGVDNGQGADIALGFDTEFVALENPYTDTMTDGIDVSLSLFGKPWPNQQVEMFERPPEGEIIVTLHRTDENGLVTLPVKANHSYLIDAVYLRQPVTETGLAKGAVWETLWASTTFAVPAQ